MGDECIHGGRVWQEGDWWRSRECHRMCCRCDGRGGRHPVAELTCIALNRGSSGLIGEGAGSNANNEHPNDR